MGLHEILGRDYRPGWRTPLGTLFHDMPREMIACNKAFPFFGEEQRVTGKILGAGQYLSLGGRILGGITWFLGEQKERSVGSEN